MALFGGDSDEVKYYKSLSTPDKDNQLHKWCTYLQESKSNIANCYTLYKSPRWHDVSHLTGKNNVFTEPHEKIYKEYKEFIKNKYKAILEAKKNNSRSAFSRVYNYNLKSPSRSTRKRKSPSRSTRKRKSPSRSTRKRKSPSRSTRKR